MVSKGTSIMTVRTIVEPALLRWGRETAGLAVEDAARRVQVPPERLESWEAGDLKPTIGQLRRLAHMYCRPLSVFFLPEPPAEPAIEIHDFRQLPGQVVDELSSVLRLQLRRAHERRQLALDLLNELDQPPPPSFDVSVTLEDDPEDFGSRLRDVLAVDLATQEQWWRPYDALNGWRAMIEAAGVLVFQASRIDLAEMRGLSLAEDPLPVIVVNSKDAPNGRVFTMLHELCHVALHRSGICELDESRLRPSEERRVEVFCNHVAGAALVPMRDLLADEMVSREPRATRWSEQQLEDIARRFSVSKFVVLRRLLIAGRTTSAFYREKQDEWLRAQAERPERGFVTPDRRAVAEGGKTFVRLVLQSYYQDHITLSDVAKYLGVRLKHLSKIEQAVGN